MANGMDIPPRPGDPIPGIPQSQPQTKNPRGFWERWRAGRAAPGTGMWRSAPGMGTARGVGRLGRGAFRLGTRAAAGLPGLVAGGLIPSDLATQEQEFSGYGVNRIPFVPEWTGLEQRYDYQGRPISGMQEAMPDPNVPTQYQRTFESFVPQEFQRAVEQQPPAYDAEMLQKLQTQMAEKGEAELAAMDPEDMSLWQSVQRGGQRLEAGVKEWLVGEPTEKIEEDIPVYNLSLKGRGEQTEDVIAKGTTSVEGTSMTTENRGAASELSKLLGRDDMSGDLKSVEKTYAQLFALGTLGGVGTSAANSFLSNSLGVMRLQQDEKWRLINLLAQPKQTLYPYIPVDGRFMLDTSKPIISQPGWKDLPPGYSPDKPSEPATTAALTEVKELQRIMKDDGLYSAWSHKVAKGDIGVGVMPGVSTDLAIGQYLAGIYVSLHPEMGAMIAVPSVQKLQEMIRDLKGKKPADAIKAGTLEREDWERWVATFGAWAPSPGMFR